jgi:hypothetical protein
MEVYAGVEMVLFDVEVHVDAPDGQVGPETRIVVGRCVLPENPTLRQGVTP